MADISEQNNSPFQFSEFKNYVGMRLLVTIGSQLKMVILGWYLYKITNDPLSLGILGLAEAIPAIGFALYAGYLVEHRDKRNVLLACIIGYTLGSLALVGIIKANDAQYLTTNLTANLIYLLVFIIGVVKSFGPPASFSTLSQIIPKEFMPKATAWNSSAWQVGAVLGPLIGGFLCAKLGAYEGMWVSFMFHFIGVIAFLPVSKKPPIVHPQGNTEPIFTQIKEGLKFVFHKKIILHALSLDLFAVLFGGATALLPAIAKDVLHVDADGLGWLRAAMPLGSSLTMIWLGFYPPMKNTGKKLLYAVAGFGITTIAFAVCGNFYLSLFFLFLTGVFDSVSVVIRSTILQLQIPENMKARVSSVNSMFISSSNELGAFESGTAAKLMGIIPSVVFGGIMTLIVAIYFSIKGKELKEMELQ